MEDWKKDKRYAIGKGWQKLEDAYGRKKVKEAKKIIMQDVIGINNLTSWSHWCNGLIMPTHKQYVDIEAFFQKYKVKKNDIWGLRLKKTNKNTSKNE